MKLNQREAVTFYACLCLMGLLFVIGLALLFGGTRGGPG